MKKEIKKIKKNIWYTLVCISVLITMSFGATLWFSFLTRDDFSAELVTGKYYIALPDHNNKERGLAYKRNENSYQGVISQYVSQTAFNDEFIIVLQHPKEFAEPINFALTNYYIILLKDTTSSFFPEENKIGPLSEKEFLDMKKKMNIKLEFESL